MLTLTCTEQKHLKFITSPEKITGAPEESFIIQTYDRPMSDKKRYLMMKVTFTSVYFQKYMYVEALHVTYIEPCRHSLFYIFKKAGTSDVKVKEMILQDTLKRHSSENQYLLLHIPDGDQNIGFEFKISIYSKPKLPKKKTELAAIQFLVKQEAAVINGKKVLLHGTKTSDCTVVGIPVLIPQGSSYSLLIKSYLGKKMKAATYRVPSVYWFLNNKNDKIVDKVNSKTNDQRFPGLEFKMGLDTSVDKIMSHIMFPDVTSIIGNNVGVSYRVFLKSNLKTTKDFDVIVKIKPASSEIDQSDSSGDRKSEISIEDGKKMIKDKMGQFGDKVSVVATRMKNIKNMSPEEVNKDMMIIAGGVGGVFVLLIIIIICCCKSKSKETIKDEEKPINNKAGDKQPTDDKKPEDHKERTGEKPMTEEQRKREKYLKERALRERALRERARKRSGQERSSKERSCQEQQSRERPQREQPSRDRSSRKEHSSKKTSRKRKQKDDDSDDDEEQKDKRKQKAKKKSKKKDKGKKKKKVKKKKKSEDDKEDGEEEEGDYHNDEDKGDYSDDEEDDSDDAEGNDEDIKDNAVDDENDSDDDDDENIEKGDDSLDEEDDSNDDNYEDKRR